MSKVSKDSKLYILRYSDENPVVYKVGKAANVASRIRSIRYNKDYVSRGYNGYTGRIDTYAVYQVENASGAETAILQLFRDKRLDLDDALRRFGTSEVYYFSDRDLTKIHNIIQMMFMDIL